MAGRKKHDAAIYFKLPHELEERAREKAKREGVDLSTVLRALLAFWVRGQVLQSNYFQEVTRTCSVCKKQITQADELAGECPHCKAILLSLAG